MRKTISLLLILIFLTSTITMSAKPVSSETTTQQNTWTLRTPMHVARGYLGVAVVDDKIYAIGGSNAVKKSGAGGYDTGGPVATNEEYNPTPGLWTLKAPMPTARYDFATAAYHGKIYCMGGLTPYLTAKNEVYDPTADRWETKAPMPIAEYGMQANVVAGKIYLIGGTPNQTVNQVYNPVTDSWTIGNPMPTPASHYASAAFDGKIFVIGGQSVTSSINDSNSGMLNQIFDTQTGNWSLGAPLPDAPFCMFGRAYGAAMATVGVLASQRIYVFSGWDLPYEPKPHTNEVYNPKNDSWSYAAGVPTNRNCLAVAEINDVFYVIGGLVTSYNVPFSDVLQDVNPSAVNERYIPIGYGAPDPDYLNEIAPPSITVLLPLSQTYNESAVSLVFSVNKTVVWAGYSLDDSQNVTVTNGTLNSGIQTNLTIANVISGIHSLTVYANDTFGNSVASENITFNVELPKPAAPFPLLAVVAVSGVIAAVAAIVSLLLYRRHLKNKSTNLD